MRISSIIWLDDIVDKLVWKHGVTQREIWEALTGRARFRFVERGVRPDEDLYSALGRTSAGRYLVVFFVYKMDGSALVVSGRDMSDKEKRRYEKK